MTTFSAAYRATVYSPRSVDTTEATVLVPRAGAVHGDAFRVATVQGLAGWQPLLELPRGWHGKLDPFTCKTEIGAHTLRILDRRTGSGNLERWLTAFLGNDHGRNWLLGCKVLIEECLDWDPVGLTGSWVASFTGRIEDTSLDSSYLWFTLKLKELSDDLNMEVFGHIPHASITYAHRAPLLPIGIVGPYGAFQQAAKIRGSALHMTMPDGRVAVLFATDRTVRNSGNLVTQGLVDLRSGSVYHRRATFVTVGDYLYDGTLRAIVTHRDGALAGQTIHYDVPALSVFQNADFHWSLRYVVLEPREAGAYGVGGLPASGVSLDLYLVPSGKTTAASPIVVDDVHVAQLLADLADGKFGRLQLDGSVSRTIARGKVDGWGAGDPWSPLLDDPSLPTWRGIVPNGEKLNDWAEKNILKPNRLAFRIDGDGKLVLIDLRRKATTTSALTITDADLVGSAPSWSQGRGSARNVLAGKVYFDEQISLQEANHDPAEYPAITNGLMRSSADLIGDRIFLDSATDLGVRPHIVDFPGLRAQPVETIAGFLRLAWIHRKVHESLQEIEGPFSTGAAYLELSCRRTANTGCRQGQWRKVNVSAQPNPAAGTRGGERIMLCVDRAEDGPVVRLTMLDAGPSAASVVPTLTLAAIAANPKHGATIGVTLNAALQPVAVHVAVVDVGDPRPAESDSRWTLLDLLQETGVYDYEALPSGRRIYVRGRSQATSTTEPQLPSNWAFPAGDGYVDTAAYLAPTNLAALNITKFGADLSWTATEPLLEVEILVSLGVVASFPTSDDRVALLPAESAEFKLRGLDGPAVQHTVGVRYLDPTGNPGPLALLGVLTTADAVVAPAMLGTDVIPLRT